MKIQVLGSGCPACKKLYESVLAVVKELALEHDVEYISGPEGVAKILELGAMRSPVLTIDDQIVLTGFTGNTAAIQHILQ